ncbi:YdeI/OmpD-associated family protein [Gryllotalpicola koreensis]|uniref:YdeI/OmpD-associated family protein n=1 Tax=Gryllotalpicola koreensis TaxID=993086 RepID=UPI0031E3E2CB
MPHDDGSSSQSATAEFDTTVVLTGNNTGIVVPDDVIERLGAGRRPAVIIDLNGYEYRSTVGVMGGRAMIGISAAIRKETGIAGGDDVHVRVTVADAPREVAVPDDFAAALGAEPATAEFFAALANSLQRYHVDSINEAKTAETRRRRIEKTVALFRAGKKR